VIIWTAVAPVLGVIVVVVLAALCSSLAEQPDPSMVWEGRVARRLVRMTSRSSPAAYSKRGVAAVQQEANFAWAATSAESTWQLRLTPSMPSSWPRGSRPWARITSHRMNPPGP
jgi:hypothetical protein